MEQLTFLEIVEIFLDYSRMHFQLRDIRSLFPYLDFEDDQILIPIRDFLT